MAAYAALASLAQVLEQNLLPHDQDQHWTLPHHQQRIKSLHENVILLIAFLDDFPEEAGTLEGRIRSAAKQAEDIIGLQISDEILSENGSSNAPSRFRRVLLCLHNTTFSGNRTGGHKLQNWDQQLQSVIKETDTIVEEVNQIKSSMKGKDAVSSHSFASPASRIGPNGKDTVVGFEQDLIAIKERLCGEPSKLQIIPIYGMGGIGKTTLARYAYDDPLIAYHFDVRAWVTISQYYHLEKVLFSLMHSMGAQHDASLEEKLYKHLKGKRYLIVMDDMWNTRVWNDLRRIFPDDNNGSRIIITSRELDVASYVHSSGQPHQINLMNIDQSWNLLRQKVFAQESCPPELEDIGRVIAQNCQGLPLAIAVIAGILLKVNQTQKNWMNIAKNVRKAVSTGDEQFLEILSLSYTHLPHHLRPCFLYLGVFPEDYKINVSKLIKLWAAEGFLRSYGCKDEEELAEEYLEDLAKRSLVMVIEKRYNGKIKFVKIHDLLREICLRKTHEEKFIHVEEGSPDELPEGIENSRGISVLGRVRFYFPEKEGPTIHTILIFAESSLMSSLSVFRLLKAVDILPLSPQEDFTELGELFHLRYLAFRFCFSSKRSLEILGSSLSKLHNLLTLIIEGFAMSYIPFQICRMPQLKHFILLHPSYKLDPPHGAHLNSLALKNLHTLRWVDSFTCSRRILKLIPNLKKLGILYWHPGVNHYGLHNLIHLHKLEKLNIRIFRDVHWPSDFFQNVAFPVTLKKLSLSGGQLPWKDMSSVVGSLPNLEVLKLIDRACEGDDWKTTEGEFCRLKVLFIAGINLLQWITESDHFPSLERLVLYDCRKLVEIPDSIGEIETLELIEVGPSYSRLVESAQRIKEEQQENYGNDYLQVRVLTAQPYQHWNSRKFSYWDD